MFDSDYQLLAVLPFPWIPAATTGTGGVCHLQPLGIVFRLARLPARLLARRRTRRWLIYMLAALVSRRGRLQLDSVLLLRRRIVVAMRLWIGCVLRRRRLVSRVLMIVRRGCHPGGASIGLQAESPSPPGVVVTGAGQLLHWKYIHSASKTTECAEQDKERIRTQK